MNATSNTKRIASPITTTTGATSQTFLAALWAAWNDNPCNPANGCLRDTKEAVLSNALFFNKFTPF